MQLFILLNRKSVESDRDGKIKQFTTEIKKIQCNLKLSVDYMDSVDNEKPLSTLSIWVHETQSQVFF